MGKQTEDEESIPVKLKHRPTDEIIAHHLGSISAWLAAISTDIRFIREKIEREFDES